MTKVIFHRSDFDGKFCEQIARRFLSTDPAKIQYIGYDYGDPVPQVAANDCVYLLDLSIPELMNHRYLIWIDHHKTAIEKYPLSIPGFRIDGVAACRLA